MAIKSETMNLPCKLTEVEMTSRRDRLAALIYEKEEFSRQKSLATKTLKDKIDACDLEGSDIAMQIRTRQEMREIEVTYVRNEIDRTIETIRMDTMDLVHSRPMTPDERQVEMFRGEKKGKTPPAGKLSTVEPDSKS